MISIITANTHSPKECERKDSIQRRYHTLPILIAKYDLAKMATLDANFLIMTGTKIATVSRVLSVAREPMAQETIQPLLFGRDNRSYAVSWSRRLG